LFALTGAAFLHALQPAILKDMTQLSEFDIDNFEQRVDRLLAAYQQLLSEHKALQAVHQTQNEQKAQLRERLNSVIERIRALEAEADRT